MDELKGILQDNPLSCAFFSKQNTDSLQTTLRYTCTSMLTTIMALTWFRYEQCVLPYSS